MDVELKILHIVQFLGIGGLEKVLNLLILEQKKHGHEIELIVYDYNQDWVQMFRDQGIIVHTDYQKNPGYDPKLWKYFYSKSKGFDIIHTHDLNPMMYVSFLKLLRPLFKIPKIVHTTHGMEHVDLGKKYILFEKMISKMADIIIGVSPAIKNYYINTLGSDPLKTINIDNGTPVPHQLEEYPYTQKAQKLKELFGTDPSLQTYVVVARVVPLKDQSFLIDELKDKKINLLIIGPSGDDEYMDMIKQNCPANTFIVGAQENVNEILSCSDLFLSASHHEGIPIAVLEAAAAGLPCLLSDIPGHRTLQNQSDVTVASYFKVSDSASFQNALNDYTSEKRLQTRHSLHQLVYNNYSTNIMYKKYLEAYKGQKC